MFSSAIQQVWPVCRVESLGERKDISLRNCRVSEGTLPRRQHSESAGVPVPQSQRGVNVQCGERSGAFDPFLFPSLAPSKGTRQAERAEALLASSALSPGKSLTPLNLPWRLLLAGPELAQRCRPSTFPQVAGHQAY